MDPNFVKEAILKEISTPSATPASGYTFLYSKATGQIAAKDSGGNEIILTGQPYRTIWIDAGAMVPRVTNGAVAGSAETGTNDLNYDYFGFDGATEQGVNFKLMMPDEWDRSTIKYKVVHVPASGASAADGVAFGLSAVAISDDDAIDATLGTQIVVTDTITAGTSADVHVTAASAALTVGGTPALGDLVFFELTREVANGSDDMTENARVLGVMIQYKETTPVTSAW